VRTNDKLKQFPIRPLLDTADKNIAVMNSYHHGALIDLSPEYLKARERAAACLLLAGKELFSRYPPKDTYRRIG